MILKPRDHELLVAIEQHHQEHGAYPLAREICKTLSMSASMVGLTLVRLEQCGAIKRTAASSGMNRAKRITRVVVPSAECKIECRTPPMVRYPRALGGDADLAGRVLCKECGKIRPAHRCWWPEVVCDDCSPIEPSSIDIAQDRIDESAEMSWVALAGRW